MKLLSLSIGMAFLATSAVAQVSANDVILAENSVFPSTDGLRLVNYTTGKARVVGKNTNSVHGTVALDPNYPNEVWGNGSGISFSWLINHHIMTGDNISGVGVGTISVMSALQFARPVRFHCYKGKLLLTVTDNNTPGNTGLWLHDRKKVDTQMGAVPSPSDLAVLGEKAYVVSVTSKTAAVALYEVDMSTTPTKTTKLTFKMDPSAPKGATMPVGFAAICAKGPDGVADTLMLVDGNGVIYEVVPGQTAWNITTQMTKGVLPPVAIAWHPDTTVGLIVATSNNLYDFVNYILPAAAGKPFHTNALAINDMALDLGAVENFGTGCQGSNGKAPTMVYGGSPYQGNKNFTVQMVGGLPAATAYFVFGIKKNIIDLKVIGAPGCTLNQDILGTFVFGLDAFGTLSIPAPVPVDNALQSIKLFVQFGCADAKANNAGLTTSQTFKLRVR